MKLTGKANIEFEKWFEENLYAINIGSANLYPLVIADVWKTLPESFKYGVYVDFFDSVGMVLETPLLSDAGGFGILINGDLTNDRTIYGPRPEARTAAIEKACEILNLK